MTPAQSRAARGWFGWSQAEFARQASVSVRTVQAFENGEKTPHTNSITAMRRAIEAAGVRLLFNKDGTQAGIVLADADPDFP
jgi:DNA-binding transcriptional regulator YiaG